MRLPKLIRSLQKAREMKTFYRKFISAGDLCFDIGANVGERTNVFLKLGASVVAVEPQKSCISILERRFGGNDRLTILNCALGKKEGNADLMICEESNECATLSGEFVSAYSNISGFHWPETEHVRVDTLKSMCDR